MTTSRILLLAGIAGLVLAAIAIPVAAVVLHRQGRAIAQSVHEEYEI